MTTLRDALAGAFEQAEQGTLTAPVETPIETTPVETPAVVAETAEQTAARVRDELGRFAAKPAETPAAPAVEAVATPAETALVAPPQEVAIAPAVEPRKPPSSWSKDQWERWNKLDPDTQQYIEKREADFAKGVSTYKGQWDQAQPIFEAVQPFMQTIAQSGMPPAQWIQYLGAAHHTLSQGTPEQKLQAFAKLATDCQIDLAALTGGQPNPQFGHVTQMVSTLQNRTQQLETMLQQQEQQRIQQNIEAFKANAPHFEAVKETMGQLLQSGVVNDLQTAYDKAIRLQDDVWQQIQSAEQAKQAEAMRAAAAKAEAERQAEIARKKAAAVSPKSSSPTGSAATGGGKQDRRAALADAFDSATSGHF
jgi:hypothetical protein